MLRQVGVGRRYSLRRAGRTHFRAVNRLATDFAILGAPAIRLAALGARRLEPVSALVTKNRIRRVFVLASRANHNVIPSFSNPQRPSVASLVTRRRDSLRHRHSTRQEQKQVLHTYKI